MMLWPEILFSFLLSQVFFVGDYFIPLENKSPGFEYWNSQPWPRGEVVVKFDSKVQPQDKVYFFQACEEWTEGSKASCREAQSHEKNFLLVKAEEGVGCWTALGYHSNPDFRVFNFNRACWNHYDLVLHEVGHVLGLLHEHQRSDRDHYIEVLEDNIIPELKHAFVKNLAQDPIHGEYDVESIMHYPAFAYTRNGKPVMQARPGTREISKTNPKKMSAQDKLSISQIYGSK